MLGPAPSPLRLGNMQRLADYKSAIQQITNLRYGRCGPGHGPLDKQAPMWPFGVTRQRFNALTFQRLNDHSASIPDKNPPAFVRAVRSRKRQCPVPPTVGRVGPCPL